MFKAVILILLGLKWIQAQNCLHRPEDQVLQCWELAAMTDLSRYDPLNVRSLQISSSNLTYLDGEALANFEHLELLMMPDNSIKVVSEDAFRRLTHLEYLDLSGNQIEYLDPTTFATNAEIESINLSRNQLKMLTPDMFNHLPLLEVFNLEDNPIDFCEINTHFALLELRYRNVDFSMDLLACNDYYELVPRKLEVQLSEVVYYLNIFNVMTLVALGFVLIALMAMVYQSKSDGLKLYFSNLGFMKYDRLSSPPESKIPHAV